MITPGLALQAVSLAVGAFALRSVSLVVAPGEILVLLGANGAGKSVILETIAGFHKPRHGRVSIDGRDVTALPPEARRVGYMFQNFALFPHLTVAQNVRFAQRSSHRASWRVTSGNDLRVTGLLERFGLTHLAHRRPEDLSGGEKQRVALARALAMDPAVFLFDEPFSALDTATRDTLRDELGDFMRNANVPAVYVTHDQSEALALGDRIAIVENGAIVQTGSAEEVFATPVNVSAARLVGMENLFVGEVRAIGDARLVISVGTVTLSMPAQDPPPVVGQRISVGIRGEDIALTLPGAPHPADCLALPARVVRLARQGPVFRVWCDCGFALVAYVTKARCQELGLAPGTPIVAELPAFALRLLAG